MESSIKERKFSKNDDDDPLDVDDDAHQHERITRC